MTAVVLEGVGSFLGKFFQFDRVMVVHFDHAGLVKLGVDTCISEALCFGATDTTLHQADEVLGQLGLTLREEVDYPLLSDRPIPKTPGGSGTAVHKFLTAGAD